MWIIRPGCLADTITPDQRASVYRIVRTGSQDGPGVARGALALSKDNIVTVEASFLRGKGSLLVDFADLGIEVIERGAQGARELVVDRQQGGPFRTQDAEVELGVEKGRFQPVRRGGIAVCVRHPVDQSLEAEPAQVIGHLRGGVRAAQEGFDVWTEVAVPEALREMREAGDRLTDRHDARIAEAQGRCPLPRLDGRLLEPIECVLRQHALVADAW